ncbi:DUF6064 family protein [Caldimonas sp. KR1-144]|uniref:DUF6064 family protein n=1 Tax=Caldimonas sp. KR1-144 TaxID=3400911 RepID=UPI003BFC1EFB
MSEWWTYRPSDLLMFSPRIYWRLFASINEAWWPTQLAVVALALGWLLRAGRAHRIAAAALAAAWAFVAWAFHWQRFAAINWAAEACAFAFALQAALLAALCALELHASASPWRRRVGVALLLWALLGHPLLAPAFGRPWTQAEVFGFAPDPTAIATLGWLLLVQASGRLRAALRIAGWLAALWLAVSAATLATMGSWQAVVPLAALGAASCVALMSIPDLRRRDPAGLR